MGWSVKLIDRLIDWSIDWLINRLIDWNATIWGVRSLCCSWIQSQCLRQAKPLKGFSRLNLCAGFEAGVCSFCPASFPAMYLSNLRCIEIVSIWDLMNTRFLPIRSHLSLTTVPGVLPANGVSRSLGSMSSVICVYLGWFCLTYMGRR